MIDVNVNVDSDLLSSLRGDYSDAFWEFTRDAAEKSTPLTSLVSAQPEKLSREELVKHAQRMFASIRIYAGMDTVGGFFLPVDKNLVPMVQACLSRCIESAVLCDEFFLQLTRMTTTSARSKASQKELLQIWKLLCITCGVVAPHNDSVYDYVFKHLQTIATASVSIEARHAQYCLRHITAAHEKRSRSFPPSAVEQLCAANLSDIQTRVYFLDKQFQTYLHAPATTMAELRQSVRTKIGLPAEIDFYTLFEVFGPKMEREMQPKENVCDIIFKWEKFAETSKSTETLQMTFKRGPLMSEFTRPSTRYVLEGGPGGGLWEPMGGGGVERL